MGSQKMIKRLFPWVFIAATVGVLVGLGSWQLTRLEKKEQLLVQYSAGETLPPLDLNDISSDKLAANAYRRVHFEGTFLHDKEVHLGGRRWHGKTGYHLATPMKLADGRIFLVNRGWIPFELKEQEKRAESIASDTAKLLGKIRIPKQGNFLTPESHPDKNFWFAANFSQLEEFTGLKLEPVIIETIDTEPDLNTFPIPSDGIRAFRNDHLGYALTWYALALAALIIFWLRVIRPQKPE